MIEVELCFYEKSFIFRRGLRCKSGLILRSILNCNPGIFGSGSPVCRQNWSRCGRCGVCSASGDIRPLRFRMEDEDHQLRRIIIDEIVNSRRIQYVGIEAKIFLCRATVEGKNTLFELKYTIRTHSWCLVSQAC